MFFVQSVSMPNGIKAVISAKGSPINYQAILSRVRQTFWPANVYYIMFSRNYSLVKLDILLFRVNQQIQTKNSKDLLSNAYLNKFFTSPYHLFNS